MAIIEGGRRADLAKAWFDWALEPADGTSADPGSPGPPYGKEQSTKKRQPL